MTIDLTEVSPQVRGFFNSGTTTGYSCAQVAYKCLTSPTDYPINEGASAPLKVMLAPGPWSRGEAGGDALVDDVPDDGRRHAVQGNGAGRARPRRSPPTTPTSVCRINGISPKDGRFFLGGVGPSGGGWGAKNNEDGMSATVCINDGDTHNHPVEQMEAKFPLLFEGHRAAAGFGGRGAPPRRPRHRAGGARPVHHHDERPGRPHALPALGPRGRPARRGQPGDAAPRRRREDRPSERQGADAAAEEGRRLYAARRRRRRLRAAVRARSAEGGRRRPARLRVGARRGRNLWCGARRDRCSRSTRPRPHACARQAVARLGQ